MKSDESVTLETLVSTFSLRPVDYWVVLAAAEEHYVFKLLSKQAKCSKLGREEQECHVMAVKMEGDIIRVLTQSGSHTEQAIVAGLLSARLSFRSWGMKIKEMVWLSLCACVHARPVASQIWETVNADLHFKADEGLTVGNKNQMSRGGEKPWPDSLSHFSFSSST